MAAFDHFRNMYDVALKPRLLRSLIKEAVPDEEHPFRSHSELSHVVSSIKTHRLLSESLALGSADQKQLEIWKSAVDSWVQRLLALVSTHMPDKCWAGICLLGVTCKECSSDRFLASYSVWFHKLLSHIQPPADSQLVKVASCNSISDLFTRLGGFSNVRKDGASLAGKLVQPVLKLLNEDSSEAVWEGALHLLCIIITIFPSSVHRHYDSAEAAIVSKIMSAKYSDNILKKLAYCLALLPKSRGDEESWSLLMQKILLSINVHLNDAFQGLEEETKCNEAIRLLVPPGKDPPPSLGGYKMSGEALDNTKRRSERLLTSSVSTLMLCCCTMLTSSYPVQVTVPVRPLLALAGRVLMVDGSFSQALFPFMTAMQQEFICSQLPVLHMYSLELLTAIIKGLRSQLLPHAAEIVRLLIEYFRTCALPELRIKVYSILRILLISMGVGIAVYLAQDVIINASVDLDENDGRSLSAHPKAFAEALLQPNHRKRKNVTATGSLEKKQDRVSLEEGISNKYPKAPCSVKIAALEALEALLTVGGASRSEGLRSNVDLLLITVATNTCKGGWASEETNLFLSNEHTSSWADFQLASLRALLASFLSPARVRPPYLGQGLELFHRGKQETGTKLAEFCAHALLALEVLIHPRAHSVADFASANHNSFDGVNHRLSENVYSGSHKHNIPFSSGTLGMGLGDPNPDDDDLYDSWLGNGVEIEVPVSDLGTNMDYAETVGDPSSQKHLSVDDSSGAKNLNERKNEPAAAAADVVMRGNADEIMVDSEQFQEPNSHAGAMVPAIDSGSADSQMELGKIRNRGAVDPMDGKIASGKDLLTAKGDGFTVIGEKVSTTTANLGKGKVIELDHESSTDSFPDIVDADPDSD